MVNLFLGKLIEWRYKLYKALPEIIRRSWETMVNLLALFSLLLALGARIKVVKVADFLIACGAWGMIAPGVVLLFVIAMSITYKGLKKVYR